MPNQTRPLKMNAPAHLGTSELYYVTIDRNTKGVSIWAQNKRYQRYSD